MANQDHLAVVFPGRAYPPIGPVLRFPALALEQLGATVRSVQYPTLDDGEPEGLQWTKLDAAIDQVVRSYLAEQQWERVTLVAKSLGTTAITRLAGDLPFPDRVDVIWLTPVFGWPEVRDGAIGRGWRSLLIAGDADDLHDVGGHRAVEEALGATSLILPGADHALEVPGDVRATLAGMQKLAGAVLDFSA